MASVWAARNQMGLAPRDEAVPAAREAALRAVGLDEGSAEAYAALAGLRTWGEWDWPAAEEAWVRALELNPNDAGTQAYYGHFLMHRGRAEEGLRHNDISVELDPFNALYHALRGVVLVHLGRYDEAMEAARTAVAIRADMGIAFNVIQIVQMMTGLRDEQLATSGCASPETPSVWRPSKRGWRRVDTKGPNEPLRTFSPRATRQARRTLLRYSCCGPGASFTRP